MKTSLNRLAASDALWERARRVMPGGVYDHQNGAAHGESHPRFLVWGEGSHILLPDATERKRKWTFADLSVPRREASQTAGWRALV